MAGDILSDLFIVPEFDKSKVSVSFTASSGLTSCAWEVMDKRKVIARGKAKVRPRGKISFESVIKDFTPWDTNNPYLYTLRMTLKLNGNTVVMDKPFGMRKIHATPDGIFVNNKRFYVRGYIRGREAHDHPNLENLPLEKYYEKNIRAAKDYGFNFIRFHSRIPPEECFRAADKLGIFIHVEIRKYFGKYQKERSVMYHGGVLVDEKLWRSEIKRIRNHPSLMVYCLGNEIRHPGCNPRVEHLAGVARKLDPTRLFLDTCAHGEFDRTYVDIDVQHMSYFYPFGKNYDMFENTYNWRIYGSCKGISLIEQDKEQNGAWKVERAISIDQPVLAHEICHYAAWRDLDELEQKFVKHGQEKPWWIDELKKLIKLKKMGKDLKKCIEASRCFQFIGLKLGIEAARRSKLLSGFHFLQLADTDRYENSNGLIDCFDEKKGVSEKEFKKFNGDSVLLVDMPRRTYFEGENFNIPVIISHFSPEVRGAAHFRFSLKSNNNKSVSISGSLREINLDECRREEICNINIAMPEVKKPEALTLTCMLFAKDRSYRIENSWNVWLYPDRPDELKGVKATVALDDINLNLRYPQIENSGSLKNPERLLIVNRFTSEVLKHLEKGGDVLMLYRVPETRDRRDPDAPTEKYYLPATWDRFKGVIWDRGHNCGAFIRPSKALAGFPNDGFADLQFHGLIDDCDKICLDDFPVAIDPIMQGVDRAVRDRFDVYTYGMSEFEPRWTLRKFGYLFELKVGRGRLFVSGFNFTGLNTDQPETCAMFESLVNYMRSNSFKPGKSITAGELCKYLLKKGKAPRIRERKMTQYWQLDEEPLESAKYWKESEIYIKKGRVK